jgi:hypothetical protein
MITTSISRRLKPQDRLTIDLFGRAAMTVAVREKKLAQLNIGLPMPNDVQLISKPDLPAIRRLVKNTYINSHIILLSVKDRRDRVSFDRSFDAGNRISIEATFHGGENKIVVGYFEVQSFVTWSIGAPFSKQKIRYPLIRTEMATSERIHHEREHQQQSSSFEN